jgi:hypothetical protein
MVYRDGGEREEDDNLMLTEAAFFQTFPGKYFIEE